MNLFSFINTDNACYLYTSRISLTVDIGSLNPVLIKVKTFMKFKDNEIEIVGFHCEKSLLIREGIENFEFCMKIKSVKTL